MLYINTILISLNGHGFGANTLIILPTKELQTIQTLSMKSLHRKISIPSYDIKKSQYSTQVIKKSGISNVYFYIKINFDEINDDDIICTLTQEFYIPQINSWIPSHKLKIGDALLSINNKTKIITSLKFVSNPIPIYTLEIKKTHTFFVGRHSILTHNMVLPITLGLGFNIPFGSAVAGSIGGCFGPLTLAGGVIAGGIISGLITIVGKNKIIEYKLSNYHNNFYEKIFDKHNTSEDENAQAPGRPTEKDGYHHPKNGTFGWPDDKGNIWVPSGPKGHGGPHWDVQYPEGGYTNVLPGGRIRGIK